MTTKPSRSLLLQLAYAITNAEHQNVARHLVAGFLWACYPDWFDNEFIPSREAAKQVKAVESIARD